MARLARRRRREESGKIKGYILGGIGAVFIAAILIFGGWHTLTKRSVDRSTGCLTDGYDSVTAILVDLTDPISPTQAAALRNAMLKIRSQVPKHGRFEIYSLGSVATSTLAPLFAACSPGSGRDVDSKLYGNPELAEKIWHKQFADKVDRVLGELLIAPDQATSPLFEGVQSVAVTAFGGPLAERAPYKRLIVVSDMLQHTPQLSLYQTTPSFASFAKSQYFAKVRPTLRGANVEILMIVRDTRLNAQKPALLQFWVEYVAAGDGFLKTWEPLQ